MKSPSDKPKKASFLKLDSRSAIVAERAAAFYRDYGRDFPWRSETNFYRLALAEILLQKTRAESALPVYQRIAQSYPFPQDLLGADITSIESDLAPLGLSHKRAAQLHRMAAAIISHGSSVFDDWKRLLADVPGLGAYGARAIACFGRGEAVGIVDANVARILRRLYGVHTRDPRAVIYQRYADQIAAKARDARATNFGLLDIGAAVCRPRPICSLCPFSEFCPRYDVVPATGPTAISNADALAHGMRNSRSR